MKKTLLLLALAAVSLLSAAENLLTVPVVEWKRDFRPGNRPDIYDIKDSEGVTRLRRFANSEFGRIYLDLPLKAGATYRLSYTESTEHGALTKMLVIFKGEDQKWREKTRLANYEPLVNGEWSTGVITFTVPGDVVETRLDFRIDSFGTVDLKDLSLTELTPGEAEAYRKSVEVKPFQPGNGSDYALVPGKYYRIRFDGRAAGEADGTLKMVFHGADGEFIKDGHITFWLRGGEWKPRSEVIAVSDNADGIRVSTDAAEVKDLVFEPLEK